MRRETGIEPGQRFQDARVTAFGARLRTVWIVDRMWTGSDAIEYALLVREDDRGYSKTISVSALNDRRNFIRVPA
jgi:hypothetical protein